MVGIVDSAGDKVYLKSDQVEDSFMDESFLDAFCRSPLWAGLIKNTQESTSMMGDEFLWANNNWTVFTLPIYEDDNLLGVIGIFYRSPGMRAIKRKMKQLDEINKEFSIIFETSFDGFTITDGQGRVLRVNRSHGRLTGINPQDMVGNLISDCVKDGLFSNPVTMRVLQEKRSITVQQRMQNGKHLLVTGTPAFDANGNIIRVVSNVRDITELKTLQDKLAEKEQSSERCLMELKHLRKQRLYHDKIIAVSEPMRNILAEVKQVEDKDVTVILLGETGVGKGIIAQAIHQSSKRKNEPFIDINCGAIPENLLESELFGYVNGAFTGARKGGKPGIFEMAQHGTLFLDEIGELPLGLQVKLLKALQEKQIRRIGGTEPIPVDVRIMCATNRDLKQMVADGDFRADLYYRLFVVPIYIPALRNRREDIVPLLEYYLDKFNQKYNCSKKITPELLKNLLQYSWPGNVRELENLIERLVVSEPSTLISGEHVPELRNLKKTYYDNNANEGTEMEIIPLRQAVEETEKHLIREALKRYGSMGKAAKSLGLDRTTVLRKISKYQIPYAYTKN
ncbi:MAG TPA: transcriptional regulator [Syntrophomonas sp.]|nr:transcriptional regulator [Syntrophomonas sp.]